MGESLQHMMPWVDWLHDHQYLGIISQGRYDHFFFPKQKKRKNPETSRNTKSWKNCFLFLPVWTLNLYIRALNPSQEHCVSQSMTSVEPDWNPLRPAISCLEEWDQMFCDTLTGFLRQRHVWFLMIQRCRNVFVAKIGARWGEIFWDSPSSNNLFIRMRVELEHFENRRALGPCSDMDGRTDWQLLSMHEVNSWRSTVRRRLQWWNMLPLFVGGSRIDISEDWDVLRFFEGITNRLVEHTRPSICEDVLHNHMGGCSKSLVARSDEFSQIMMVTFLSSYIISMPSQTFPRNSSCSCESWILWSFDVRHSHTENWNSQRPIQFK